ncbi:MAG: ATP-grasp domain-containing protein [Pseudomonadota bacterium]
MQWILQEFEDTSKLAEALERLGIGFSWHKVVPFVGELSPEPVVPDTEAVVLFGSYTLWRYAALRDLKPGVFRIRPFVEEEAWDPYLLNGGDALFLSLRDVPEKLPRRPEQWFLRPVEDSKEEPGRVRSRHEIIELAEKVLRLDVSEIPRGSLRHDTRLMLTLPREIRKEWRVWIVSDRVVTYSMYKEGSRVIYRQEIDEDALAFAHRLVDVNPGYAPAYVMDICRTDDGLHMLETNCINAAGFYDADLMKLAVAIEKLAP